MNLSNKEKTNVLVLLSGGIDSASCAHFYKTQGFPVETLFIDYGQKSLEKEADASKRIAKQLSLPFSRISLTESRRKTHGELIGRNAFFLFSALMEFRKKSGIIGIGLHSGTPYYDCSEDFVNKTQGIFDNYTNGCIKIGTPFLTWNKMEVFDYFKLTGIPSVMTYSCEIGESQPCGICRSCKDLEAFYASEKH
jgi:7-cyano-7-deazaguanine synthase